MNYCYSQVYFEITVSRLNLIKVKHNARKCNQSNKVETRAEILFIEIGLTSNEVLTQRPLTEATGNDVYSANKHEYIR